MKLPIVTIAAVMAVAVSRAASAQTEGAEEAKLPSKGVVSADRLNVRRGPGVNPPIGQLTRGTALMVRTQHEKWYEIDYPSKLGPWIHGSCVDPKTGLEAATADTPLAITVASDRSRLRSLPSRRGLVLDELPRGAKLALDDPEGSVARTSAAEWPG